MKHSNIINDQELFFNLNSQIERKNNLPQLFYDYANKEQVNGFRWITNAKKILEYGSGIGLSLDLFFKYRNKKNYNIYGVDIAELAIEKAKKKYPKFRFYKITNNKIPQIKDRSLDAAFMLHVLHHSKNHKQIFREIHSKLKKGGKFLINDLSSNNFFVKSARSIFTWLPKFIKNKFKDDLVVDGNIPEKYKVKINLVISQLKKNGFIIKEIEYGHLFFFIFIWIDKFIPLSKSKTIRYIYKKIINFEKYLLHRGFFNKQAEVFSIKCIKS